MPEKLCKESSRSYREIIRLSEIRLSEMSDNKDRHQATDDRQTTAVFDEASPPLEPAVPDRLEESRETDWPRRDEDPLQIDPRKTAVNTGCHCWLAQQRLE